MRMLRKRLLSLALAAVMLLSLLPAVALPAAAVGDGGDVFTELGFNTGAAPDGYVDDGSNPYGRDKVAMNPVAELFVGSDISANAYNSSGRTWGLYGENKEMTQAHLGLSPTASTPNGGNNKYDAYRTAVGDFTGSGKKDIVVALGANTAMDPNSYSASSPNAVRSNAGLDMFFIQPKDGNQGWGNNVFKLYQGAIGNNYERSTGFLKFDPKKDSENGLGYYNPILLQNYMQVATGDFTGDGIDEVAVYIPDPANPRVEVYQLQYSSTGEKRWWDKPNWKTIFTHPVGLTGATGTTVPNKVSMVAGDLNYDGVDDLAIGYGYANYGQEGEYLPSIIIGGGHSVDVLFAAAGKGGTSAVFQTAVRPLAGSQYSLRNFSLALGDLLGTGRDSLVVAETYEVNKSSSGYRQVDDKVMIQSFAYNPDSGKFISAGLSITDEAAVIKSDSVYPMVRSDAVALSPGVGQADRLYYRGFLFSADGSGAITRSEKTVYQEWADTLKVESRDANNRVFFEYGITAADIDNDFSEELVLSYNHAITNNDGPRPYPTRGLVLQQSGTAKSGLTSMRIFKAEPEKHHGDDFHWPRSCILMAVPDVDNDTMLLEFKKQHLSYSDPKLMAVLAGAPVYADLEHLDNGDGYVGESYTSWATSKGSGGSQSSSKQFNAGLYFGYEHNVTLFGAPLFSVEFEAEYSHAVTWETEKRSTVTHTVEYGTTSNTDSVVLYCVPVAVYVYEATIPAGPTGNTTTKQEFTVNIPFSPAVTVMSVEDYEQVVDNYDGVLPSIREGEKPVLTHTQGDPNTYPRTAGSFPNARVSTGDYAMVGYGNGFVTRTISIEEEESSGTTHSDEISFEAGGGVGGVKAGVTLGAAFGYGSAKITTSGTTFTGSVYNMPNEARGYGYAYSWKLLQYQHTFPSGEKVPVVTYLVETAQGGSAGAIPPPQNLDIDVLNSTTDTLTLTWDYPPNMGVRDFQVFRYNLITGNYVPLENGVVAYHAGTGSYQFKDTELSEGSQYSYRVQARRASGPSSLLSPAVSGWTLARSDIKLTLDKTKLTAYPDDTYVVRSTLVAEGARSVTYMWERFNGGKWQETGIGAKDLTLSAVKPSASGDYRLRASMEVGGKPTVAYSPTLTVTAMKRTPEVTVTIRPSGGQLILEAIVKNTSPLESGAFPTGPVTFELSYQGEAPVSYTEFLTPNPASMRGTASFTVGGAADGAYSVTARYGGDAVFQSLAGQPVDCVKGGSAAYYYLTAPRALYYGDTLAPQLWKVSNVNGKPVRTEVTNNVGNTITDGLELTEVMKQQIIGSGGSRRVEFVRAVGSYVGPGQLQDYEVSNMMAQRDIRILRLDPNNFTNGLNIGVGRDYHYEAKYLVFENSKKVAELTHQYIVYPRPVTVTAKGGEVQQSDIKKLQAEDFVLSGPAKPPVADRDNLMDLIAPVARNTAGSEIAWSKTTPLGNYFLSAKPITSAQKAAFYDLSFVAAPVTVTGPKYTATLTAGPNGTAAPARATYTAGARVTFTAQPSLGYEVDQWTATIGGTPHYRQTGGTQFSVPTQASNMEVRVTFKSKNTTLSFGALPAESGTVTASVSGGPLGNGTQVMEGTPVTLTAAPKNAADGIEAAYWRVYTGGSAIPEIHEGTPGANGSSTLSLTMPGQAVYVSALFEQRSHTVTFPEGILQVNYTRSPYTLVRSGDLVPHGTQLDARAVDGVTITAWSGLPVGSVTASDGQSGTFPVTGDVTLDTTAARTYVLKVAAPTGAAVAVFLDGAQEASTKDFTTGAALPQNTAVKLTVTPENTHGFLYWLVNGGANTSPELALTMTGDYAVEAVLSEKVEDPVITFPDGVTCVKPAEPGPEPEPEPEPGPSPTTGPTTEPTTDPNTNTEGGEGGGETDPPATQEVRSGSTVAPGTVLTFTVSDDTKTVSGWYVQSGNSIPQLIKPAEGETAGNTLTFTMPHHSVRVFPLYEADTITVTVTNGGNGSYTLDGEELTEPKTVPINQTVSLRVVPHVGYLPVVKVNEEAPLTNPDPVGGSYVYGIPLGTDNAEIKITYQDNRAYTITAASANGGTFTVGKTSAKEGDTVTLSAVAGTGYVHSGWTLAYSGTTQTLGSEATSFTMPAANVIVYAIFAPEAVNPDYTITLEKDELPAGCDFSASTGTARAGTTITLTAAPAPNYRLEAWTVTGGDNVPVNEHNQFIMPAHNVTVKAVFAEIVSRNITLVDDGRADGGAFSASHEKAAAGTSVTLTARPEDGRPLQAWAVTGENSGPIAVTGQGNVGTFVMPDEDVTVAATFGQTSQPQVFDIRLTDGGSALGGSFNAIPTSAEEGHSIRLYATPEEGYTFGSWTVTRDNQEKTPVAVSGDSFIMPGDHVIVSASFTKQENQGGGGGGGGGGSTTEPVEPPKEEDKTVVDDKTGDSLIQDAVDNNKETIIIDAETPKVSLPADFLTGAGAQTNADILITTPVASVRLPNGALGELASLGGEITVQATLEKNGAGEQVLTLDITADGKTVEQVLGGVKVTVPYTDGNANTVAVRQTGGRVLPKSFARNGQMTVPLSGPDAVVLADNPKEFPDTAGHWGSEYINFVTSHELFQGTGDGAFAADAPMTRGMLWTVLSRLEGADTASTGGAWYAPGMEWAKAAGISDGSNPEGDITREQLAVMLWRVAGSPPPAGKLEGFGDAGGVSDFAEEAMRWAVEAGVITGKDGGVLDPIGSATRAEVSAMLMRFIVTAI